MMASTYGSCRGRRLRRWGAALVGVCGLMGAALPASPMPTGLSMPSSEEQVVASDVRVDDDDEQPKNCTPEEPIKIKETPAVLSLLGIKEAWKHSSGDVVVAVVDSGVVATNPHLGDDVLLPGFDFTVEGGGDGHTDLSGHGTAIAGQIAARSVEGSGLRGLAPKARILPVRTYEVMDDQGGGAGLTPDNTRNAAGIRWAAEQGAKIIAVAQSSTTDLPELREAVSYATSLGSLVVASAGNTPQNKNEDPKAPRYPAAYPEALSVTAVDGNGAPTNSVVHGEHIDVAAPGGNVLTTFFSGDCILSGDKPTTSYATGYMAGIAALVAAARPSESPADWKYRILATALRPSRSQRDNLIGWGLVAPTEALNFINDGSIVGPPNPRFPAPQKPSPVPMTPPDPTQDPRPARAMTLGTIAGAGILLALVALLAARLRELRARQSR